MFDEFNGKVVLVTGASSGIGSVVALKFASLGAKVAVHYNLNSKGANSVVSDINANGGEAFLVQGDVSEHDVAEMVVRDTAEHFGRLDVLINNAGSMLGRKSVEDAGPEHFEKVMNLNARSVYSTCHAAIPYFRKQNAGNIINTTSIAARTGGAGGAGFYASAKAAVSALTHYLAKELAGYNVRVNAVSPGVITTPFHDGVSSEEQLEAARMMVPMGRLGTAEECVGTYLYLASDELSGYVNGQVIEVNGGQLMP